MHSFLYIGIPMSLRKQALIFMNKIEYNKLLLADEWKEYSYLVKRRDNFRCRSCGSDRNLHVHHLAYKEGLKPWDYPRDWVVTLCNLCHYQEHKKKQISSFFIKGIPENPFKRKGKKKRQQKKKDKYVHAKGIKYKKLTRKQKKVQEFRNKLKSEGKLP